MGCVKTEQGNIVYAGEDRDCETFYFAVHGAYELSGHVLTLKKGANGEQDKSKEQG
jgi:hypothetical protein